MTIKSKTTRTCECGRSYRPINSMQSKCVPCLAAIGPAKRKLERVKHKQRTQAARTRSEAKPQAQQAFNCWIRHRDAALPCISCGETNPPMKPGGQWDAGHFLGRGAYPELAFNEDNCHKQCKSCNAGGGKFKHKERTVNAKYETNLIDRIGVDRVAVLKGPHPPMKLSVADYDALRNTYRARLRQDMKD